MRIRSEEPKDRSAIRAVHEAAFGTSLEADIVDALRAKPKSLISLVAETEGEIIGHILFSPVSLADQPHALLMGLGPLAVAPEHQRQKVGSALVRRGLELCRDRGYAAVVVLGHAEYYPRFGFVPASQYGIRSRYDAPDEAFMAVELQPRALRDVSGEVAYDEAFGSA
jgi:putative acetyltransferase